MYILKTELHRHVKFIGGVTGGGILKIIRAASPRCFYTSCYPPGHAEHVPDRFFYIFVLACIFFSEAGAEGDLNFVSRGKGCHVLRPASLVRVGQG